MHNPPLILMVAPNGAYKKHAQHPAVPMTPESLAITARACLEAGAAMLHMHVRKADGAHSLDAEAYLAASAAVRRDLRSSSFSMIETTASRY